jgi:hypothetical protein
VDSWTTSITTSCFDLLHKRIDDARRFIFLHVYAAVWTVISSPSTRSRKLQTAGQGQQAATEEQGRAEPLAFASRPLAEYRSLFSHQPSASFQGSCNAKTSGFMGIPASELPLSCETVTGALASCLLRSGGFRQAASASCIATTKTALVGLWQGNEEASSMVELAIIVFGHRVGEILVRL